MLSVPCDPPLLDPLFLQQISTSLPNTDCIEPSRHHEVQERIQEMIKENDVIEFLQSSLQQNKLEIKIELPLPLQPAPSPVQTSQPSPTSSLPRASLDQTVQHHIYPISSTTVRPRAIKPSSSPPSTSPSPSSPPHPPSKLTSNLSLLTPTSAFSLLTQQTLPHLTQQPSLHLTQQPSLHLTQQASAFDTLTSQYDSVISSHTYPNNPLVTKASKPTKPKRVSPITPKRRNEIPFDAVTRLEQWFKQQRYLSCEGRKILSKETGLPEKSVMYWFQNKRRILKSKTGADYSGDMSRLLKC